MAKRYSLPEGQTYRPFGSSEVVTNQNITDELVEQLIKADPSHKKAFIDSEGQVKKDENKANGFEASEISKLTKKELHAKYVELTGKAADEKLNHPALVLLVTTEMNAKALLG